MSIKVSLIISTYNWPEALYVCLKSVLNQKVMPDQILVADDGSGEETRKVVEKYKNMFPVPFEHVWQEDDGFQLARIRNKAIARATSEYIIQVDGDLILHPYFVSDHKQFAKPNTFVRASRIYLDDQLSKDKMQKKDIQVGIFEKGVTNFFSRIRLPFLWKFLADKYKTKGNQLWEIHGCNMAFWRSDAIAVNGYNEDFKGWGPEDKEFITRLLNRGVHKRFLKFGGVVFHLWHRINKKENLKNNECLFIKTRDEKLVWSDKGIDQYLEKKINTNI